MGIHRQVVQAVRDPHSAGHARGAARRLHLLAARASSGRHYAPCPATAASAASSNAEPRPAARRLPTAAATPALRPAARRAVGATAIAFTATRAAAVALAAAAAAAAPAHSASSPSESASQPSTAVQRGAAGDVRRRPRLLQGRGMLHAVERRA